MKGGARSPETLLLAGWLGLRVSIPDDAAGPGLETLVACLPIAALLALVAIRASRRQVVLPAARWWLPFVALAIWTLLACAWAPAPYAALCVATQRWSEAAAVGLALLACADPSGRRALAAVLGGLAAMSAAYAVAQWLWIQPATADAFERAGLIDRLPVEERGALLSRLGSRRAFGTFAIANTLAALLVMSLPILVASVWSARGRATRAAGAGLGALVILGIAASGSKGGFLALLLVGCALAWGGSRRRRMLGVAAVLAAVLVGLATPRLHEALERSASVRMGYWRTAAQVWLEAPVHGVGPGQFDDGFFRHKAPEVEEARHAHSAYLEVAAETGAVGLALFLVAWVWPLIAAWRRCTEERPGEAATPPPLAVPLCMLGGIGLAIVAGGVLSAGFGASAASHLGLRAALLAVAWTACHFLGRVEVPRRFLVIGGLGLLAHAAIDFDLEVPGLAAAGVVLVAVAAPRAATLQREDVGSATMTTLVVGGLLGALVVLRFVGVQDLLADRGRPQFLEAPAQTPTELRERLATCESAESACPIDPALPRRRSRLLRQVAGAAPDQATRDEALALAVVAARRALSLDPRDPGLTFELAQLVSEQGSRSPALRSLAIELFEQAVAAYDANPAFHLTLADAIAPTDPARARLEYAAALDRDARIYERNRARLGLTDEERRRAERRSGR